MSSHAAALAHLHVQRWAAERDAERLLSMYSLPQRVLFVPRHRFSGNSHQRRTQRRARLRALLRRHSLALGT